MRAFRPPSRLTRRQILEGAAACAASSLFPGCASSSSTAVQELPNPQPTPSGPITSISLTVTATPTGTIGPAFAGLSYEKFWLYQPLFTPANTQLIGLFATQRWRSQRHRIRRQDS
jgi:hypothetical protein